MTYYQRLAKVLINLPREFLPFLEPTEVHHVALLVQLNEIAPCSANTIFKILYEQRTKN